MDLGFAGSDPSPGGSGFGGSPTTAPPTTLPTIDPATSSNVPANPDGPPKSRIHENTATRYFAIKSNSGDNLVKSVENKVWASQRFNNQNLSKAFETSPYVVLIFSVNKSGMFQGYARMISRAGEAGKDHVFNNFGATFDVEWLQLHNLGFQDTEHIINPLNEDQPVKICRDGQELPHDVGKELCELLDRQAYDEDPANFRVSDGEPTDIKNLPPAPKDLGRFKGKGKGKGHHNKRKTSRSPEDRKRQRTDDQPYLPPNYKPIPTSCEYHPPKSSHPPPQSYDYGPPPGWDGYGKGGYGYDKGWGKGDPYGGYPKGGYDGYGPPSGGYDDGYGAPRQSDGYGPPRGNDGYGPPRGSADDGYGPPKAASAWTW